MIVQEEEGEFLMIMSQHHLLRFSRIIAHTSSTNMTEMPFIFKCFGSHAALSHSVFLVHSSKSNYCEFFITINASLAKKAAFLSTSSFGLNTFMGHFKVTLV